MLDIESYRNKRSESNMQNLKNDIINALSDPENIQLWKTGVDKPTDDFSESFSHFHGFRNSSIDRASVLAQNGPDRFLANKVEHALDPYVVQKMLKTLVDLNEDGRKSVVREFVEQRLTQLTHSPLKLS